MENVTAIEILSPRLDEDDLDAALERYAVRHRRVVEQGYMLSVPDNPMGVLRFHILEVARELDLPLVTDRFLLHLSTFHTREHVDQILQEAAALHVQHVLVVTGDGSDRLPKLDPAAIGADTPSATSVELLRYIHRTYPNRFSTGVAFNPYEPEEHEWAKLQRKIKAGAAFVITQPVLAPFEPVDRLQDCGIPVIVGGWMSINIQLLADCVGYDLNLAAPYDPIENLRAILRHYPGHGLYLSLMNFKRQWEAVAALLQAPAPLV